MRHYQWVTVKSSFHGTETRMRAELTDMYPAYKPRPQWTVSKRQVREAWGRVCGLKSCQCGTQYSIDGEGVELVPADNYEEFFTLQAV